MAAIPGIAFLLIGIAMSVYAKFLEGKTDNSFMTVFFWIGIAFIAIGALKTVGEVMSRNSQRGKEHEHSRRYAEHKRRMHELKGSLQPRHEEQRQRNAQVHHRQMAHHPAQYNQYQHIQKTQMPQHLSIIACPRCGSRHYSHANFCQMCGTKMK